MAAIIMPPMMSAPATCVTASVTLASSMITAPVSAPVTLRAAIPGEP